MRWNVVIGGQLFSKSFLGYTTYKVDFVTREGLLPAIGLMLLPFVIFVVLVKLLPPWPEREDRPEPSQLRITRRLPCRNPICEASASAEVARPGRACRRIERQPRSRAPAAGSLPLAAGAIPPQPRRCFPRPSARSCRCWAAHCWGWPARTCCAPSPNPAALPAGGRGGRGHRLRAGLAGLGRAHARRAPAGSRAAQPDGRAGAVAAAVGGHAAFSRRLDWRPPPSCCCFTLFGLAVSWRKNLLIVATIATLAGLGTAAASADGHPRRAALHFRVSGHRRRRGDLRLPGPLAERALAGGRRGRSGGAAGHLAGHQRSAACRKPMRPSHTAGCWRPGGAAGHLSGQHHRAHAAARLHLHRLRNGAMRGGVPHRRGRRAAAFARGVRRSAAWRWCAAGACYVVSFVRLDARAAHGRNFYTYSTFGILLALAGSRHSACGDGRVGAWLLLAMACIWAGDASAG